MASISFTPINNFLFETIPGRFIHASNSTIGASITCGIVSIDMAFQAIKQAFDLVRIRAWEGVEVDHHVYGDYDDDEETHNPIEISIPHDRVLNLAGNIQGALFYGACAANILPGAALFGAGLFIIHSQKTYTGILNHDHINHDKENYITKFFFNQFESIYAIHEFITKPKDYNPVVVVLTHAVIPALRKITDLFADIYKYISIKKIVSEISSTFSYVLTNKRKIGLIVGVTVTTAFCVYRLVLPKYFKN
jgi:hypothetical protein